MTLPWPLPEQAHVPGRTARPATSPAYDAARAAPARTDPAVWRENLAYRYGLTLVDAGFFWEAHEVLEAVQTQQPPAPSSLSKFPVPRLLEDLAMQCLRKSPAERPDAAEFIRTLQEDWSQDLSRHRRN